VTPEEFVIAFDEQLNELIRARDVVRTLITVAPEINNNAENNIKDFIRDHIEAATDAIVALELS
jgi:N-acetylglucosamine-6-phosphate deacetylase